MSSRDSLLEKSRKRKTAAWVLLGGGSALALTGVIVETRKVEGELLSIFEADLKSNSDAGEILLIGGLASMAGSIPLFIASHKKADKAIYMKATVNTISIPVKQSQVLFTQAAISLNISL